ncbi:MAG: hypothetical protein FJ387_27240 [Verrucomicrobia bacterium]|nr:hypothetical protein [Verrucomicrobiota bacterium]
MMTKSKAGNSTERRGTRWVMSLWVAWLCGACWGVLGQEAKPGVLAFTAAADGGFRFDTGVLAGKLRAGGKSLGLTEVVHRPSGLRLDRSNGLLSHYRVFTVGQRYGGGAWDWPSHATLRSDGSVDVQWPATTERPFTLQAAYRWYDEATLDVETRVLAVEALAGFEVFQASYFSEAFRQSLVYAHAGPDGAGGSELVSADGEAGEWQMFPRADSDVPRISDGRWQLMPNPVTWRLRSRFRLPIGLRCAPEHGVAAVMLAHPEDCFAIATPHQTEGHYSMYFSLFGGEVPAGHAARARTRLVIGSGMTVARVLELHAEFSAGVRAQSTGYERTGSGNASETRARPGARPE